MTACWVAVQASVGGTALFFGPGEANGIDVPDLFSNTAVNNKGVAIGTGRTYAGGQVSSYRPWRWVADHAQPPQAPGTQGSPYLTTTGGLAVGVNDSGVVVATLIGAEPYYSGSAARYAPASTTPTFYAPATDDPGFDPSDTRIYAINNAGVAVGASSRHPTNSSASYLRAVRWGANSTVAQPLAPLGQNGSGLARPNAINDSGIVVGSAPKFNAQNQYLGLYPVRWAADNSVMEMPLPTGARAGSFNDLMTGASAINRGGVSVGSANRTGFGRMALRWTAGGTGVTELVGFQGSSVNEAHDVNDAGTVVGTSFLYDAGNTLLGRRAVRWPAVGTSPVMLQPLGANAGGYSDVNVALRINGIGAAVGYSTFYFQGNAAGTRAVLWLPDSTAAIDLNTLANPNLTNLSLTRAADVSDTGFITGIGTYFSEEYGTYDKFFTLLVPQAGTYGRGDANFDTAVNFLDLLMLAQNYNQTSNGSVNKADFNLDGVTNFLDLLALAQNYNQTFSGSIAGDWSLVRTLVPEPAALMLFMALVPFSRRRSREVY